MLGVLMTMLASLVTGYSRAFDHSGKKDRTVVAMSTALSALRAEVAESVAVLEPVGGTASRLELAKVDPAQPTRLTAGGVGWTPYDSGPAAPSDDFLVNVTYDVRNGGLVRTVAFPNGASESHLLVEGVTGFSCTDAGDGSFEAVASLQERERTRNVRVLALRRVR